MLRKIRIALAIICFVLISLLFLDFTGTLHKWFGIVSRIQLIPALLALNVGAVIFLMLLTVLFGRVYCSIICPLGVFQDIISRITCLRNKYRFRYLKSIAWLRYGMLVIFCISLLANISIIVTILEPYSSYGRIASNLLSPFYLWINNILAYFAQRMNSYVFYPVDVWIKNITVFFVVVAIFVTIGILAWKKGRIYCNTVCPVGTILGFISRFSIFKPHIDVSKCNNCKLCERTCKSSCINSKEYKIDYSRCVSCMKCIDICKKKSISFSFKRAEKESNGKRNVLRRSFLLWIAAFVTTSVIISQSVKVDGGLALIENKKSHKRTTKITPPGSESACHFNQHCTGCQLCVAVCPNAVLRPSGDLSSFMQPEMSFERGYCRLDCNKCSQVCPNRAIKNVELDEKASIRVGYAVFIEENCVIRTDGVSCGNCARRCPVGAIQMVKSGADSCEIPVVDIEKCIGCGACEYHCPARPYSAIYVEGRKKQ